MTFSEVFDGLRPREVQQRLWDRVKGTEKQSYVADPQKGSVHNYGFAVDLSLQDEQGKEVDMGTPFDSFEPLAQPKLEERFLREGKLSPTHVDHRRLLRDVMESAGFKQFRAQLLLYVGHGKRHPGVFTRRHPIFPRSNLADFVGGFPRCLRKRFGPNRPTGSSPRPNVDTRLCLDPRRCLAPLFGAPPPRDFLG